LNTSCEFMKSVLFYVKYPGLSDSPELNRVFADRAGISEDRNDRVQVFKRKY
jgi:hypothetical protein